MLSQSKCLVNTLHVVIPSPPLYCTYLLLEKFLVTDKFLVKTLKQLTTWYNFIETEHPSPQKRKKYFLAEVTFPPWVHHLFPLNPRIQLGALGTFLHPASILLLVIYQSNEFFWIKEYAHGFHGWICLFGHIIWNGPTTPENIHGPAVPIVEEAIVLWGTLPKTKMADTCWKSIKQYFHLHRRKGLQSSWYMCAGVSMINRSCRHVINFNVVAEWFIGGLIQGWICVYIATYSKIHWY